MPLQIPQVYRSEICPLEGYEQLQVRVLANASDAEWKRWLHGDLGAPDCPACAKLVEVPVGRGRPGKRAAAAPQPTEPGPRLYCAACQARRAAYGESIVLFYGPELLGEDVSTPAAALALLDRDDALPSEIVYWLHLLPAAVRNRRSEELLGNLTSFSTTPS